MIRVGWLADKHDPPGGAELTQAEFRAVAPEGVEVVEVEPSAALLDFGADVYVLHNHLSYDPAELRELQAGCSDQGIGILRYFHDMRPQVLPATTRIFCSPLQREALHDGGPVIPPPLNLKGLAPPRQHRRNGARKGACCIGAFMNPGKGGYQVAAWAAENEPVDVYGFGPFLPQGPGINYCGPLEQPQIAQTLWQYERFVFLPTALEPFGRCVVEAWAAGCELIVNGNVGARYWIEEAPEKLESASSDFWAVVTQ